jgi:pimeloyl-ACP methyl ester carboxylesterase
MDRGLWLCKLTDNKINMFGFALDCWLHRNKRHENCLTTDFASSPFGKIRVYDSDPQNEKKLPVLLMVPDGPCFVEHFMSLIEKTRSTYRTIVFDMPGFGYSFPKNNYDHTFENGAIAIESVLQHKKISKGIFAFSCANGFYAWRLAAKKPEYFEKLILIQTPDLESMRPWAKRAIPAPVKISGIGQLFVHWQKMLVPKIWFGIALPKNSPLAAQYTETSRKELSHGACNCLASVVQGCFISDPHHLEDLKIPVTLIWGDKDHSHKKTDPNNLLKSLPKAKIIRWSHVGHFANLEDPEQFLDVVKNH